MKIDTYKAFRKLEKKVDALTRLVSALVRHTGDEATMLAVASDLQKAAASLKTAIPAQPSP